MSGTRTNTRRSRRGKCLTDQERADKRARERERVQQAVEELRSSEGWQRWLETRSRFHRYSLGNQLLIASQRDGQPTTTVAGFRKWLKLGYCVRKGQHALYIYAPCPPSKKEIADARERGEEPRRTFFKMTPVFAQDQVDPLPPPAEPIPLTPPVAELEGDDLKDAWMPLVTLARAIGSKVILTDNLSDACGAYDPASLVIYIGARLSVNARVKTLVHEIAHALVRADKQDDDPKLSYAQEELVVESIAYSVTGTLGLDASGYSIGYLTSWSTNTELAILEQTAKLINRLANRIEDAIPVETLGVEESDR